MTSSRLLLTLPLAALLTVSACGGDTQTAPPTGTPTTAAGSAGGSAPTSDGAAPSATGGAGLTVTGTVPSSACTIVTGADIAAAFGAATTTGETSSSSVAGVSEVGCDYGDPTGKLMVNGVSATVSVSVSTLIGGSEQGFDSVYLGTDTFSEADAVPGIGRRAYAYVLKDFDAAAGTAVDAVVLTDAGLVLEVELASTSFDNSEAFSALATADAKAKVVALLKTGTGRL